MNDTHTTTISKIEKNIIIIIITHPHQHHCHHHHHHHHSSSSTSSSLIFIITHPHKHHCHHHHHHHHHLVIPLRNRPKDDRDPKVGDGFLLKDRIYHNNCRQHQLLTTETTIIILVPYLRDGVAEGTVGGGS